MNFVLASPVAGVPSLTTLPHQICCMRLICILICVLSWCLLSLCILSRNPSSFVAFYLSLCKLTRSEHMPAVDDEKQPEFDDVETHAIVADTSDLSPHQFSAPDRHSALPCVPPLISYGHPNDSIDCGLYPFVPGRKSLCTTREVAYLLLKPCASPRWTDAGEDYDNTPAKDVSANQTKIIRKTTVSR